MLPSSPLPWHTTIHGNSPGATIKDSNGNIVGIFPDWMNAEFIIECIKNLQEINKKSSPTFK